MEKSSHKQNTMQTRELVSIPFERVAINLVGPFHTAIGTSKFLLTCIDLATRWPEAILIRTAAAKIVIAQLTNVFSRCGFLVAIVSAKSSKSG